MARPPKSNANRKPRGKKPSGDSPEKPGVAGWQSRLAAAELITLTLDEGFDLETAFDRSKTYRRLEGPDRGFARAIAGAALRGVGRIGWALGGMVDRPIDQIEPPVRALLFAGAAQMWLLGVKDHAAVSATVEAASKWYEARRGGGLINAVLRRAARETEAFKATPATAVWPDWLAARLKAALGPERAEAMAMLQLEEPPIDVTLKPALDAVEWASRLGGVALANGSVRLEAGAKLPELPGYADGEWWVQDTAASIAAKLMGDISGKAVADLCAAPGGKALQLASMGAKVSAIDISKQRLVRVRENAERTKLPMEIIEADARQWRPGEKLDAVLLDAPCSALGILRRHPEGIWRRDPKDLARFPVVQRALIEAAADMLKPGGVMVYCVCTPAPEEGLAEIERAVSGGGWRRLPVAAGEVPGFGISLTPEGDLLTSPAPSPAVMQRGGEDTRKSVAESVNSDVFYIARLERTEV
jgi:16S rRNA (cytosine967-C5)-methyltransferase